jgi:hypothetical protein
MFVVLGTIGARTVQDDGDGAVGVALVVVVDGAVGVQELVGDVGQDGCAARRDAAFGDEGEKIGEEFVDGDGGLEVGEFPDEFGGEIDGVGRGGLRLGVAETETGPGVHDGKLTAATAVGVMAAAGAFGGAGFGSLVVHFRFLEWREIGGIHPHGNRKSPEAIEGKGVAGAHCAARVRKKQKIKWLDREKSAFGRVPERSGASETGKGRVQKLLDRALGDDEG